MKNRFNKAHSLAEVLMVLVVIGIVMAILLASARKGRADASIRYAYYQQLTTMQTIAGEILSKAANNQLPATSTDFCDAARAELNIIKFRNCTTSGVVPSNDENNPNYNFEASGNARFYNGAVITDGYTFLVDVNGREGRARIATPGDGNNRSDIFRFAVYPQNLDGYMVLPDVTSKAARDADFLSATLVSRPNGEAQGSQVVIPGNVNIDYRAAVCRSGRAPAPYCNTAPAVGAYNQNGITCSGANNPCHVIINKPAPPFKL